MKIALDAMSINTEDMDMEALEGADGFDLIEQEEEDYKG
jgi:RNA polymerase primary sigma factor